MRTRKRTWPALGLAACLLAVLAIGVSVHADHKPGHNPGGGGGGPGGGGGDPADPGIACSKGENSDRLMVMDEDGSNATQIHQDGSGAIITKSWSPDGGSLAFALANVVEGWREVWRIDVVVVDGVAQGQNPTRLGTARVVQPAWSPLIGADEIAVVHNPLPLGSDMSLQLISAVDGALLQSLYTPPAGYPIWDPTWSSDASEVAFIEFSDADATYAIKVVDVASGSVTTELPPGQYHIINDLDWARHADLVAFSGRPVEIPGIKSIHQLDLTTGEVTQLTTGDDTNPTWAPDGSQITFDRRRRGANWDVWTLDLGTGQETRLFRGGKYPDWRR